MGQQVTFNSGSVSLEKFVVNSKIDLHRDSRRSEDKQRRGMKWVYGKRGVNGMEGRILSIEPEPDLRRRRTGSSPAWISLLGMDWIVFSKTSVGVGEG